MPVASLSIANLVTLKEGVAGCQFTKNGTSYGYVIETGQSAAAPANVPPAHGTTRLLPAAAAAASTAAEGGMSSTSLGMAANVTMDISASPASEYESLCGLGLARWHGWHEC